MSEVVLDASALLALLRDEPGAAKARPVSNIESALADIPATPALTMKSRRVSSLLCRFSTRLLIRVSDIRIHLVRYVPLDALQR